MNRSHTLGATVLLLSALHSPAALINEYPLAGGSSPVALTLGADGNIWFTEMAANKIGRITNAGVVTEFSTSGSCAPYGISTGLGGLIWYTCTGASLLGHMDTAGNKTESAVTARANGQLATGADGRLWYGTLTNTFARIYDDGTTADTSYALTGPVNGVASGPQGGTWLLTPSDNSIWIATAGGADVKTVAGLSSSSFVVQCRGAGWFTENAGNAVASVPYTSNGWGTVTPFPIPGSLNQPTGIACAPDGSVWFALAGSNKIARLMNDGSNTYQDFPIPTSNSSPLGVAIGSDGSVWFAEHGAHKIGRLRVHPPGDVDGSGAVNVTDVFYLINFLFAGGPAPPP